MSAEQVIGVVSTVAIISQAGKAGYPAGPEPFEPIEPIEPGLEPEPNKKEKNNLRACANCGANTAVSGGLCATCQEQENRNLNGDDEYGAVAGILSGGTETETF